MISHERKPSAVYHAGPNRVSSSDTWLTDQTAAFGYGKSLGFGKAGFR
jgi:hypothetical protein